jgi:hypothetical protein
MLKSSTSISSSGSFLLDSFADSSSKQGEIEKDGGEGKEKEKEKEKESISLLLSPRVLLQTKSERSGSLTKLSGKKSPHPIRKSKNELMREKEKKLQGVKDQPSCLSASLIAALEQLYDLTSV